MSNANVSSGRFVNCDSNLRQVQFRNGVSAIIGEWGDAAQISRSHKGRQAVIKRRDFYAQTEETDGRGPPTACRGRKKRNARNNTARAISHSLTRERLQFGCINDLTSHLLHFWPGTVIRNR